MRVGTESFQGATCDVILGSPKNLPEASIASDAGAPTRGNPR